MRTALLQILPEKSEAGNLAKGARWCRKAKEAGLHTTPISCLRQYCLDSHSGPQAFGIWNPHAGTISDSYM